MQHGVRELHSVGLQLRQEVGAAVIEAAVTRAAQGDHAVGVVAAALRARGEVRRVDEAVVAAEQAAGALDLASLVGRGLAEPGPPQ